ncbi:uncharacterized protein PV07_09580 [Cladophialophora immunda]|uniref:DUF7703 domain-containing protein n=1 Tax=Cladophialophora immunda TaxID=569365 RepID=A0A0D2CSE2_9EURO|nr:uncharacterized protein PV07_09580 [Cladophialophora immunda]KIW26489.1 hypothetical protein PV07_09580 [Cladophialophora immunda]OQV01161.1 hypothetical protein CLAIMM_06563 [Cladophialophora immunda]
MASNSSASSSSFSSAAEGITGGYTGDSLTIKVMIAFFLGLSLYNALELQVLIFGTFKRFRGLYFWSLLISSIGIIPYSIGFIFKYFSILTHQKWFSLLLLSIGWYPMITGQAVVLYSRLHLLLTGDRRDNILRWTKWMIIINAIVLHIPTTVLTIGSNTDTHTQAFVDGYNVMEKVQMCGFFLQEVILSSIYIIEAIRILRSSVQPNTKRLMYQLLAINVLIITLDLGLLGLECASLYILETITKPAFYSIKLKLEFAILGKLVDFVGGRNSSLPFAQDEKRSSSALNGGADISEFVDLTKVCTDVTRTSQRRRPKTGSRADAQDPDLDLEIARLEHVETLPSEARRPNGEFASPR